MKHFIVDIEADGPVPHLYSMVSFGAVLFEDQERVFYGQLRPISEQYDPRALSVSGLSREDTMEFEEPQQVMHEFALWVDQWSGVDSIRFVSDNAGFDWQFINYYFHRFVGRNPFGFSPMSLTWLYKGFTKNSRSSFKHLRKTKHTHNALDDARGNAEALQAIVDRGFKL